MYSKYPFVMKLNAIQEIQEPEIQEPEIKKLYRKGKSVVVAVCLLVITFNLNLNSQNGLFVEFYDGSNFEKLVSTGTMSEINLNWYGTPPVPGIDPEECSIRWTGRLMAPKTGAYKFSARVDDGIRVWVGDQLLIDNWQLNDLGISVGKADMQAGQFYDLKVEYFNALIEGEVRLMWEIPEEDEAWYDRLFSKGEPEIIHPEYFYKPIEKRTPKIEELVADLSDAPPNKPVARKPKKTIVKKKKKTPPPNEVIENTNDITKAENRTKVPPSLRPEEMTPDVIKMFTPEIVQFDRAQVDILPTSFGDLDVLAAFLSKNSFLNVRIEGHTDVAGDPDKNMKLSERRAYAVARYLVKNGVTPQAIEAVGLGGTEPLIRSINKIYHPENRRVSFVISVP
ncbi:MAG: outer membrane protein OmpA-like peptidoglycan-associated protein [Saprospiraceae bacterium]|jgi:outer membrane protein OmpA-like peptidoglycan-associated protein